jgi:hypothetical protein
MKELTVLHDEQIRESFHQEDTIWMFSMLIFDVATACSIPIQIFVKYQVTMTMKMTLTIDLGLP